MVNKTNCNLVVRGTTFFFLYLNIDYSDTVVFVGVHMGLNVIPKK